MKTNDPVRIEDDELLCIVERTISSLGLRDDKGQPQGDINLPPFAVRDQIPGISQ